MPKRFEIPSFLRLLALCVLDLLLVGAAYAAYRVVIGDEGRPLGGDRPTVLAFDRPARTASERCSDRSWSFDAACDTVSNADRGSQRDGVARATALPARTALPAAPHPPAHDVSSGRVDVPRHDAARLADAGPSPGDAALEPALGSLLFIGLSSLVTIGGLASRRWLRRADRFYAPH